MEELCGKDDQGSRSCSISLQGMRRWSEGEKTLAPGISSQGPIISF